MTCNLFPAVYVNQDVLEFRSCVSGEHNHDFNFNYTIDSPYHIEISQSKENGIVTFRILINGREEYSIINTEPSAILLFSKLCN